MSLRRLSTFLLAVCLVLAGLVLSGCDQWVVVAVDGKVIASGIEGPQEVPTSNELPKITVTDGPSLSVDLKGTTLAIGQSAAPCGAIAEVRPLVRGPKASDPWVEVKGFSTVALRPDSEIYDDGCVNGLEESKTISFPRPPGWNDAPAGSKLGLSILVRSGWGLSPALTPTCSFWSAQTKPETTPDAMAWNDVVVLMLAMNGCIVSTDFFAAAHTGRFEVQLTPAPGAASTTSTAPTARIVTRAAPVWVAGGAYTDARTLWYEVDGRGSTDPGGGALTYSWDLDGDGTYGDVSATSDPAGTLPTGVAIVPVATLTAAATAGRDLTVGVKVTNAAGQISSAATTTFRPLPNQSYNDNYRSDFGLDTATPAVGATVTLTLETPMSTGGYGCVDADADGVYETTVTLPHRTGPALSSATTTTTALAAGPHVVTVVFISRYFGASCANPAADATPLTFRQIYTSVAARSGAARSAVRAAGYTGTGELRLRAGSVPVEGTSKPRVVETRGTVLNGTFTFPTSRGDDRPMAFTHLRRGTYVARWKTLTQEPQSTTRVGAFGKATLLLHGVDGTLQCLAVDTRIGRSTFTVIGGTGLASRVHGTFTGDQLSYPITSAGVFATVGGTRVLKPFTAAVDLATTIGAPQPLPPACRSLLRYLPKAGGGGSTPAVVTG